MKALKVLISNHPVLAYFTMTLAISWGGAFLAIGGSGGMQGTTPASDPRFAYALIAMLAGPSLTGIFLTALVYGPRACTRSSGACSRREWVPPGSPWRSSRHQF